MVSRWRWQSSQWTPVLRIDRQVGILRLACAAPPTLAQRTQQFPLPLSPGGQSSRTRCEAAKRKHAARWLLYTWCLLRSQFAARRSCAFVVMCNRPCSMAMSVWQPQETLTHTRGCQTRWGRAGGRAVALAVPYVFRSNRYLCPLVWGEWGWGCRRAWVTCASVCVTSKRDSSL